MTLITKATLLSIFVSTSLFADNQEINLTKDNNSVTQIVNKGLSTKAVESSLKTELDTLGKKHPDAATSYNNIGQASYNKGEYDKVIEFYNKALKIRLVTLGENHPSTATSYNNIATLYYKIEKYQKAYDFMGKAIPIMELKLGKNHPDVKVLKDNLEFIKEKMEKEK